MRSTVSPLLAIENAVKPDHSCSITLSGHATERMEASTRDEDDPLESDIAFHAAILDATDNRVCTRLGGAIDAALRTSIQMTNRVDGAPQPDANALHAEFGH